MASLINNGGGNLKRLCFDSESNHKDDNGWGKVVELFKYTDLTSLEEFDTGRSLPTEGLVALCRLFSQNKGPRKLIMTLEIFQSRKSFPIEDFEKLGKSLSGNTKIQQIKLVFPDRRMKIIPSVMLGFLYCVFQMPSLKWLEISSVSSCRPEEETVDDDEMRQIWRDDLKMCQQLIVKQLLERNIWVDLSSWMGEDFTAMLKMLRNCRRLLGCNTNELTDGFWADIFAIQKANQLHSKDILFFLLGQLPRLCQQVSDQAEYKAPNFIVPHCPNCPGCHKRQKVDNK